MIKLVYCWRKVSFFFFFWLQLIQRNMKIYCGT